jgi:hypothetical protein
MCPKIRYYNFLGKYLELNGPGRRCVCDHTHPATIHVIKGPAGLVTLNRADRHDSIHHIPECRK